MERKTWRNGVGFTGTQGTKRESKPCHGNGMDAEKMAVHVFRNEVTDLERHHATLPIS